MLTSGDFMVMEERRKDYEREAQIERMIPRKPSPLQVALRRLLAQFGDAMGARFKEEKPKAAMEKPPVGRLAPRQG